MGMGFIDNVKVEKPDVKQDEKLDKWIDFLEELCEEVMDNFNNILKLNDKTDKIANAKKGNEIHSNIKMVRDYILDYAALNEIKLEEYFSKYYSNNKHILTIFNQGKNKDNKIRWFMIIYPEKTGIINKYLLCGAGKIPQIYNK